MRPAEAPPGTTLSQRLRLASYNIHKCVGLDGRRRPERIVDVVNALSADIVALQEVDRRLGPRPAALPHGILSEGSDLVPLSVAPDGPSLGWHGQTILVHPRHLQHGIPAIHRIDLPGLEPRGAIMADIPTEGGWLRVIAVHLGLLRASRIAQLRVIHAGLARLPQLPTVILGDFNEWSVRGGMAPLDGTFRIHAPGRSYPATQPVARLDRIALGPGLHLQDAGTLRTPLSRIASDHLPIWADIRAEHA